MLICRDLKLENVLLTSSGHVKLADFGLATVASKCNRTFCGEKRCLHSNCGLLTVDLTRSTAQELWSTLRRRLSQGRTTARRWISGRLVRFSEGCLWLLVLVGILAFELVDGSPPFTASGRCQETEKKQKEIIEKVKSGNLRIPEKFSPELENFCLKLLERNAAKRLEASKKIRNDRFFWGIEVNYTIYKAGKTENNLLSFSGKMQSRENWNHPTSQGISRTCRRGSPSQSCQSRTLASKIISLTFKSSSVWVLGCPIVIDTL